MKNKSLVILLVIFTLAGVLLFMSRNMFSTRLGKSHTVITPTPSFVKGFSVILNEQNQSGENGIVTFEPSGSQTLVNIKIVGFPVNLQPAHIHLGTCDKPGEIKYPLVSIKNGASQTLLNINIDRFSNELPLILNIHKSNEESNVYFSCGVIKPK